MDRDEELLDELHWNRIEWMKARDEYMDELADYDYKEREEEKCRLCLNFQTT